MALRRLIRCPPPCDGGTEQLVCSGGRVFAAASADSYLYISRQDMGSAARLDIGPSPHDIATQNRRRLDRVLTCGDVAR